MTTKILVGDVRARLSELADKSIHMCWTSPPYWGLRAYGTEPQVWGGDPACAHEWGDMQRNGKRGDLLPADKTTSQGRIGYGKHQGTEILNGGHFCVKCGAWRGEHGQEPTLGLWLDNEVEIFRGVKRVLRDDGTLWVNIGDAYATSPNGRSADDTKAAGNDDRTFRDKPFSTVGAEFETDAGDRNRGRRGRSGNLGNGGTNGRAVPQGRIVARRGVFKAKDRLMLPARLAIALQADGWWLRDEIVLHKLNPMPSSVKDRTTPAHEMLYMFSKKARYFYDAVAIHEACNVEDWNDGTRVYGGTHKAGSNAKHGERTTGRVAGSRYSFARDGVKHTEVPGQKPQFRADREHTPDQPASRQKRSVWSQAMEPFSEAHFATAPTGWVRPCILAGTSAKGVCSKCGAPWVRQTKASFFPQADVSEDKGVRGAGGQKPLDDSNRWDGFPRGATQTVTTGFAPSCSCKRAKVAPATVLDPFGGAGTTAVVAEELGRNAVLTELNPVYAKMARKRIRTQLGRVDSDMPEDCADDLPLFQPLTPVAAE